MQNRFYPTAENPHGLSQLYPQWLQRFLLQLHRGIARDPGGICLNDSRSLSLPKSRKTFPLRRFWVPQSAIFQVRFNGFPYAKQPCVRDGKLSLWCVNITNYCNVFFIERWRNFLLPYLLPFQEGLFSNVYEASAHRFTTCSICSKYSFFHAFFLYLDFQTTVAQLLTPIEAFDLGINMSKSLTRGSCFDLLS